MVAKKFANALTDDATLSSRTKKLLSILFLVISLVISLFEYTGTHFFIFKKAINIQPTMESVMISLAMLLPLYARGILVWRKSVYNLIVFVLLVAAFASIADAALLESNNITRPLLIAAIALSWLGMRSVAGLAWLLVFAAAAYNLNMVSEAMDLYGAVFIGSAFLGLVFHADIAPELLIGEIVDEYKIKTNKVAKRISGDVDATAALVKEKT